MNKKNRKTLKNYFKKGNLPTEQHFSDLIDSTLNTIDDGFEKTMEDGLKISTLGQSDKLIGFYRNIETKSPVWSISFDEPGNRLVFKGNDSPVLSLDPKGRVGVNKAEPRVVLDVAGEIASTGRMGTYKAGRVPADGEPQVLLEGLDGCRAYEIMAGVGGGKRSGQYALVHAIAVNTYQSGGKVVMHESHYGSRCNRLKLWWEGPQHDYSLMIQTLCGFGENVSIQYHITELWFDHFMADCHETGDE